MGSSFSKFLDRAKSALLAPLQRGRARPRQAWWRTAAFRPLAAEPCPVIYLPPEPWLRCRPLPTLAQGSERALFRKAAQRTPGGPRRDSAQLGGSVVVVTPQGPDRCWQWKARCLRCHRSLAAQKVARLQHKAPRPGPGVKETRLQWALARRCHKGKGGVDGSLWLKSVHLIQRPASAFRPVCRDGVARSYIPRPGPLVRIPLAGGGDDHHVAEKQRLLLSQAPSLSSAPLWLWPTLQRQHNPAALCPLPRGAKRL